MSNRKDRRRKTATDMRATSSIAGITGVNCTHGQCAQVRTLVIQQMMQDGRTMGMSAKECRGALKALPGLLCQPARHWPPVGVTIRQRHLVQVCFTAVVMDMGASGLLGQRMSWYPKIREMLLQAGQSEKK